MSAIFERSGAAVPTGQTDFFLEAQLHARSHPKTLIVAATSDQAAALTYFLALDPHLSPILLPDLELMPYDQGSVSPEIIEERHRAFHAIATDSRWLVIASPFSLGLKLPSWPILLKDLLSLTVGQEFSRTPMVQLWRDQGYCQVPEVTEPLEFALRGEIIDWFPVGQEFPLRLSVVDGVLESLRTFDPQTQRSLISLTHKLAYPSKDMTLSEQDYPILVTRFRRDFSDRNSLFYHNLTKNKSPKGLAFFMPLLLKEGEKLHTFFELIERFSPHIVLHPLASKTHALLLEKAEQCFIESPIAYGFTPYAPKRLFMELDAYESLPRAPFSQTPYVSPQPLEALSLVRKALTESSHKILFTVVQAPRIALLNQWLSQHNIAQPVYVSSIEEFQKSSYPLCWTQAPFEEVCCISQSEPYWIVPYTALTRQPLILPELSAKGRKKSRAKTLSPDSWENITYVVHDDHGVAKYHGLKILQIDNTNQEFIELEYAEGGRLFLPAAQITAITPYQTAPDQELKLHKLGQSKWTLERDKAQQVARDQAAELLEIYAQRSQSVAHAMTIPAEYEAFSQEFLFTETADQERAITEVLADLQRSQPMDRLICGDVGFGKTEVALRACFISAMNKKQVLFLAPTTLLAQQHYETLLERMSHWGLKVALLSRHSKKDQEVFEAIELGAVSIVVGTHSLLQEGRKYADLGLIIVDEEHRFGVRDKERLKKMRHQAHWLSMTATPIPRTLSMSLQGLRDLSLIATPPVARRLIITTVNQNTHELVKNAIERELFRSGQVYYLCNDIARIAKKVDLLQSLCPQARIAFVHGQMPHAQMERQMNLFYQHACDVLVCTTIIETGIDVAKAHTILIEDAHEFGLAQLHQLRGRVGRSHHQAYAYCLIPVPFNKLTPLASSRLEAFTSYQELGSGYHIATHDLEIRGAGEVLGERQSGHIHQIGLDYYQTLLDRASKQLRSHQDELPSLPLKIDFGFQPGLSSHQIPDPVLRMKLYRQWALLETEAQWLTQSWEFSDRFGNPDRASARWQLFHRLRILAGLLQLSELSWTAQEMRLAFHPKAPAMDRCIQWLHKGLLKAYPKSPLCLAVKVSTTAYDHRAAITYRFLETLSQEGAHLDREWMIWKPEKSDPKEH